MLSSSRLPAFHHFSPNHSNSSHNFRYPYRSLSVCSCQRPPYLLSPSSSPNRALLRNSVPLAASLALILWSSPVCAGVFSGFPGIESIPGPQLPQIDFLNKFNEENQKKYADLDERFKQSPLLKELLEKSKINKERNKREIQDKYCLRGAEWGVGVCSTDGMSEAEKEKFISMLKQKAGTE